MYFELSDVCDIYFDSTRLGTRSMALLHQQFFHGICANFIYHITNIASARPIFCRERPDDLQKKLQQPIKIQICNCLLLDSFDWSHISSSNRHNPKLALSGSIQLSGNNQISSFELYKKKLRPNVFRLPLIFLIQDSKGDSGSNFRGIQQIRENENVTLLP